MPCITHVVMIFVSGSSSCGVACCIAGQLPFHFIRWRR